MPETTAQRTLVKSPPELWAELSDATALARHLEEIAGEIRITRVEPETTVVWEGERASGAVELAASGWGTKVTLRINHPGAPPPQDTIAGERPVAADAAPPVLNLTPTVRALLPPPRDEPAPSEPAPTADVPSTDPPQVLADEVPEPEHELPLEAEPPEDPAAESDEPLAWFEAKAAAEHEPDTPPELPTARRRRGFFTRWFGRGRPQPVPGAITPEPEPPAIEPEPEPVAVEPEPVAPEPEPVAPEPEPASGEPEPEPVIVGPEPEPEPIAVAHEPEPMAAEATEPPADSALDIERLEAMLSEMLDTLGSAHHRPFSRG